MLSEISSSYRIDGKVEPFDDLLNALINLKLFCLDRNKSVDIFATLMGKAIYATAQKAIKNAEKVSEDTYEIELMKLGACFDENGVYNGNLNPTEFMLAFTSIFGQVLVETESFVLTMKDQSKSLNTRRSINGKDLSQHIIGKYSEILNKQSEVTVPEITLPKEPKKIVSKYVDSSARTEVKKYYLNGEVVGICEDINYLNDLLQRAGYQNSEIRAIIKKMKAKIKETKEKIVEPEIQVDERIFSESNLEIYEYFVKDLESRTVYNEEYFVIKHHIAELSALYDLAKLPDALAISDEDATSLSSEVSENIWPLIGLMNLSDDNSKDYNLYYLLNSNGVGEIIVDIETLDKQHKALVPKLLKKLSDGNTNRAGSFKYRGKININYISHGKLTAFYLELLPNKYLVLGVSNQLEEMYGPIASRLGKNFEERIEELRKLAAEEIVDIEFVAATASINEFVFEKLAVQAVGLKLD